MAPPLRPLLDHFSERLTKNFSAAGAVPAQPEDQLKAPIVDLLEGVGAALSLDTVARTEAHATELGVRPDVGISVDNLLNGHVELKAPGKGARGSSVPREHFRAAARSEPHPRRGSTRLDRLEGE